MMNNNVADWKETLRKVAIALLIASPGIFAAYTKGGLVEAYAAVVTAIALAFGYDIRTLGKWAADRIEK